MRVVPSLPIGQIRTFHGKISFSRSFQPMRTVTTWTDKENRRSSYSFYKLLTGTVACDGRGNGGDDSVDFHGHRRGGGGSVFVHGHGLADLVQSFAVLDHVKLDED